MNLDGIMSTIATSLISLVIWFLKTHIANQKEWQAKLQSQITDLKEQIVMVRDKQRETEMALKIHITQEVNRTNRTATDTNKDVKSIVEYILALNENAQNGESEEEVLDHGRVLVLEKKVDAIISALTKRAQQNKS